MNISSLGRRLLQIADVATFGTVLGLGTAAYKNTGTSGNTVPLLDGVNTASGIWTFSANPSMAGGAISFPATQVASAGVNDLDDYEEGTFTPVLSGTTAAGAGTYSVQTGGYTKIGNRVFIDIGLTWSAHTGTGNMIITGLPFTAGANAVLSIYWEGVTYTATPMATVGSGASQIGLRNNASNAGPTDLPMDTAGRFIISGIYRV